MKYFIHLFFICLFLAGLFAKAQLAALPAGRYEALHQNNHKWEKGDLVLLSDTKYKVSSNAEVGEYRFSVSAQRVFFTSGPLKGFFAKATAGKNNPQIIFPAAENARFELTPAGGDVIAYYKPG